MTSIRRAKDSDLYTVQELACKIVDIDYRIFLGDKGVDWLLEKGVIEKYVEEHIADCWVLELEGKIIGFFFCKSDSISLIMVDCDLQRKGYGLELLRFCESMMFPNYNQIKLESFQRNEKANNFFRKHGWIEKEKIFDKKANSNKIIFVKSQ